MGIPAMMQNLPALQHIVAMKPVVNAVVCARVSRRDMGQDNENQLAQAPGVLPSASIAG